MDRVWTYWEGPRPPFIDACLASMARHCGERLTILTPDNWREHTGGRVSDAALARVQLPAHRADVLRAAVMAVHGGVYLDADTVCLRPPDLPGDDVVCSLWDNDPPRVLNGYIRVPAGHPIGEAWLTGVLERLWNDRPRGWTDLGEGVLTPLLLRDGTRAVRATNARLAPRDTWLPIDVDADPKQLFRREDWRPRIRPYTLVFGLNHSWMRKNRRQHTLAIRRMWRPDGPLVHRLLRDAT